MAQASACRVEIRLATLWLIYFPLTLRYETASGGQRLDMRNIIAAPYVLLLAMAVCACGLPLVAQNGVEKSFSASPAEKNPVLHGADDNPVAQQTGKNRWIAIVDALGK